MGFSWKDLLTAVGFNIGGCLLFILIFNILRNIGLFSKFYHAKRHLSLPFRFRPPELPKGFFKLGWMKMIFTMSDDKFVMCAGFDALTYCKFFSLCIRIMLVTSVLSMCVILPINVTGDFGIDAGYDASSKPPGSTRTYEGFQATTIANIKEKSNRLWAHTIVMVIVAIAAMWLMDQHWKFAIKWRVLYNARTRKGTEGHTIMLQDIPGHVGKVGKAGKQAGKASKKMQKTMPSNADEAFFTDTHYDVYKYDLGGVNSPSGGGFPGQMGPVAKEFPPPRDISARRDLDNYEPRPPPTDFEPWKQAEAAIGEGTRVEDIVRREFTRDFGPHAVQAVNVVRDCSDFDDTVTDYTQKRTQLLDLADTYLSTIRKGKAPKRKEQKVKIKSDDEAAAKAWGTGGQKVDKLDYLMWDVDRLYKQIRSGEHDVDGPDCDSSAAFVTARTRLTQSVTTTGLLSFDEAYWHASPAPSPNDVIWENVAVRSKERKIRAAAGWAIWFVLVMVFLPIVAALQTFLSNLAQFAQDNEVADTVVNGIPVVGPLVISILPSLALVICLILVPIILKLVAQKVIKLPALSAVDFDVGKKFFLFTFVIVFLGNTIFNAASSGGSGGSSGSSYPWDALQEVFGNPNAQDLLRWLGTSVANASGFFLSFIFTKGLFSHGFKFLKLPKAIIYAIVSKISKSRRAEHRAYSQAYMAYGPAIPFHTIFFLIALTFCTIQPFMPLFTLIYYLFNYFFVRYDMLYIMREPYQSGGMFWPVLHQQMFVGLVTFLAVNTGYMITLLFVPGIIILAVMLVFTIPYYSGIQSKYARPMSMLSIHAAADLDRADTKFDWLKDLTPEEEHLMHVRGWDTEESTFGPIEDRYKQPSLRVRDDDHQEALRQGELAQRLVGSYQEGDPVPEEIRDEPDEDGRYTQGSKV